jgi:hypothetical protein
VIIRDSGESGFAQAEIDLLIQTLDTLSVEELLTIRVIGASVPSGNKEAMFLGCPSRLWRNQLDLTTISFEFSQPRDSRPLEATLGAGLLRVVPLAGNYVHWPCIGLTGYVYD